MRRCARDYAVEGGEREWILANVLGFGSAIADRDLLSLFSEVLDCGAAFSPRFLRASLRASLQGPPYPRSRLDRPLR